MILGATMGINFNSRRFWSYVTWIDAAFVITLAFISPWWNVLWISPLVASIHWWRAKDE